MKTLFYSCIIAFLLFSCGDKAEDYNVQYVALDQNISKGTIQSFESAKNQLDSLKRSCEKHKADIEFKTDAESVRELANINTVLEKITNRITALGNERQEFEKVYSAGKESFETIESCNNYLRQYPDGLKRIEVESEYNNILSSFVDDVAGQVQTHFTGLSEANTDKSIFQLANYTSERVGGELVEYQEEDYEKAFASFTDTKNRISQVLNTVTVDLTTAKGNSPRSLKKLYDDYEGKLSEMRTKRENMVRELVLQEMQNGGWESQAKAEITSHIGRDRGVGGIFSSCRPYEISNSITQAEEYTTTVLSSKIELFLHYNISSYCGTNGKYKYYDAKFKLVFPIIENKLGDGFFDSKVVVQK